MAVNPLQVYGESRQARENPRGYALSKAYDSSIARSDSYTPTGKTNIANAVRGFLGTGDFVGAVLGFGSNALSITGTKTNEDGTITKTTYATPFSIAGAFANPIGFGVSTAYGMEMSRSTNFTATGHTNVANSILGGLAFGPIGALLGGLANLIGGLFGRRSSKAIDPTKLSTTNTFSSPTYTGFGSDTYAQSIGLSTPTSSFSSYTGLGTTRTSGSNGGTGTSIGGSRSTSSLSGGQSGQGLGYGASNTGYSGYGTKGYTGFGSNAYGATLGSKTTTSKTTSKSGSGRSGSSGSGTSIGSGSSGSRGGTSIGGGSSRGGTGIGGSSGGSGNNR